MSFYNIYDQGMARVATAKFDVSLGNPQENARQIIQATMQAASEGACLVAFPELSVTGCTVGDLVKQEVLLKQTARALATIANDLADLPVVVVVGAPLRAKGQIYNCAVTIGKGELLCVRAKEYLPRADGSGQARLFSSDLNQVTSSFDYLDGEDQWVDSANSTVAITDVPGLSVAAVVGADGFASYSVADQACTGGGATVLVNIDAHIATVGRQRQLHSDLQAVSARNHCAYLYVNAGAGESSNDSTFDGFAAIYEDGKLLAQSERFVDGTVITYADIDVAGLVYARSEDGVFTSSINAQLPDLDWYRSLVHLALDTESDLGLRRPLERFPFVTSEPGHLEDDCLEAFQIQVQALVRRMRSIGNPNLILGVSGGLDSTHALLVCVQAMDLLGRPRTDIKTYTLPGFATTLHTKTNAQLLCESLGVSFAEIDIRPAATQMLRDLKHPAAEGKPVYDVTFENVQAGLRADYLFRLANHEGGLVVGTGDLSELALGWCTYGVGDHMSHYAVNAGIPKTMMQHLIRWVVKEDLYGPQTGQVLTSILNTEVTPELIPTQPGEEPQSTAASVGPYELHDFTVHYLLRRGFGPRKIAFLQMHAWGDKDKGTWPAGYPAEKQMEFDLPTILKWLRGFYWRFFAGQFKRTCVPNGPKVMDAGALSPRGAWMMPSDACAQAWISEIDQLQAEL